MSHQRRLLCYRDTFLAVYVGNEKQIPLGSSEPEQWSPFSRRPQHVSPLHPPLHRCPRKNSITVDIPPKEMQFPLSRHWGFPFMPTHTDNVKTVSCWPVPLAEIVRLVLICIASRLSYQPSFPFLAGLRDVFANWVVVAAAFSGCMVALRMGSTKVSWPSS